MYIINLILHLEEVKNFDVMWIFKKITQNFFIIYLEYWWKLLLMAVFFWGGGVNSGLKETGENIISCK